MAVREIEFAVSSEQTVPESAWAGVQYEDRASLITFVPEASLLEKLQEEWGDALCWRIDFSSVFGGYDPSENLTVTEGRVSRLLPLSQTAFGERIECSLVAFAQDGEASVTVLSRPCRLEVTALRRDGAAATVIADRLSAMEEAVRALKEAAAQAAAEAAEKAGEITGLTASASSLPAGSAPTVTKTGGAGEVCHLAFGLPKGDPGDDGADGKSIVYTTELLAVGAMTDIYGNDIFPYGVPKKDDLVLSGNSIVGRVAYIVTEGVLLPVYGIYGLYSVKGDKGDPGDVESVNGKTGAVTLTFSDVGAASPSGYYADAGLGAATAENLIDVHAQGIPREFLFDSAAGEASIAGNGTATILEIKGNSVAEGGTLVDFRGTGIVTTGFNLFDKSAAARNKYIDETGGEQPGWRFAHSDYIRILPGKTYTRNKNGIAYYYAATFYYDENKNYIGHGTSVTGGAGYWKSTAPNNAHFVRMNLLLTEIDEYCFSFSWSGYRDGDFEPYNARTLALPISTYFPTGMKKAGTVYDSLTADKAVQRVGTRAYQAGDEDDETLLTDGTNTNYPLETPVETVIDPPLNLNYQISDFGTETVVSTEETAPLSASIRYSMDFAREVANLPKNYVSAASMANFLTVLGSVTGGTWSMTYNAETGEYDFTHTGG